MENRRKILEKFEQNKEFLQDKINIGIEQNRKGFCNIKIIDKNNLPINGAKIKIKQINHEFRYGANIFMLDEFENKEKNEIYKEYFKECFNMATLPFYWSDLEPERGKTRYDKASPKVYRRPAPDLCLDYCEKYGIEPREHALCYSHFFPDWLDKADVVSIKKDLEKRYTEISTLYADKINTIEVTNETWWGNENNQESALYETDDYVEYAFKLAEKYFPNNKLTINEASFIWDENARSNDKYYMQIERALKNNARIDAVGMQYHMFYRLENEFDCTRKFYDPVHLYKVLDRYSDFNIPLQITEVTIPAYSNAVEDEEIQAEIIRNLYSIWFSHKNVEQIIYWNVVDGYAAFAPQGDMKAGENYYHGGLIRFDMTPKPAYYTIKNLFEKEWRTNDEKVTDSSGNVVFKGFYGEYEVEIEKNGRKTSKNIKLSNGKKNDFEIEI